MNPYHFYLSIVSHGHDEFIINNSAFSSLAKKEGITIIVMDNIQSSLLKDHCIQNGIDYLFNQTRVGFGENNNTIFEHCINYKSMLDTDYFIVINPDVILNESEFENLVQFTMNHEPSLFTINLFLDKDFSKFDTSVRYFPSLMAYFKSFFLNIGYNYDKSTIHKPMTVDWASASFLGFKASLFQKLNGFDEDFFMYCEDIDICARAKASGTALTFIPSIKAVHMVQQKNWNIFSKHFWWHLKSILTYFRKTRPIIR